MTTPSFLARILLVLVLVVGAEQAMIVKAQPISIHVQGKLKSITKACQGLYKRRSENVGRVCEKRGITAQTISEPTQGSSDRRSRKSH